MITRYDYNHTVIEVTTQDGMSGTVAVLWPHRLDPIHVTTSLDLAMRWVDAYRDGQHWAVESALPEVRS